MFQLLKSSFLIKSYQFPPNFLLSILLCLSVNSELAELILSTLSQLTAWQKLHLNSEIWKLQKVKAEIILNLYAFLSIKFISASKALINYLYYDLYLKA